MTLTDNNDKTYDNYQSYNCNINNGNYSDDQPHFHNKGIYRFSNLTKKGTVN